MSRFSVGLIDSHCLSLAPANQPTKANAVYVFPKGVKDHLTYHRTGIVKPHEIFDVVISEGSTIRTDQYGELLPRPYVAALVYGDPTKRKTAAVGPEAKEVEEALKLLLRVLAAATNEVNGSKLRTVERGARFAGGTVYMEL